MKKVLVMVVGIALMAAPAFGTVVNSKHDLSSVGLSGQALVSDNVNEVCVFCHTPHGGTTAILAPLWNRSTPGTPFADTDLYNSATLDQTNSNPTTVLNQVNNSDAPLCMSCHDGGGMAGGLLNNPASNGNLPPTFTGGDVVLGDADLGTDLTNDHPIGMDYVAVQTADGAGFKAIGSVTLPFYSFGGTSNVMWCSTCHDVHDEGGGSPFLNMSNASSALCVECHNK